MTTTLSTRLYFTHGIEIENHLVSRKADGEVLVGENLIQAWEKMFEGAAEYLKRISKDKKTPKEIAKRIVKVEVREELKRERRLKFVFINYRVDKKNIPINVFGPDPNIGQITWLLELVTPPCQYLEEMEWWVETLYSAALYGLKNTPDVALLPIGLNPTEKRVRSGLTCGEHHHIGIPKHLLIPVYNLLRNFIPHMIAISASSPFLNQTIGGKVLIRNSNGRMERKQIIGRCTHSYRLLKNSGQMGPNIPNYLPVLDVNASRDDFSRMVKKSPPDDRMVDLFPFTDYSTIELRFFDAQPWPENRLAIVLLIQAIAKKAVSLTEQSQIIPAVSSPVLYDCRRKAVQFGLLAQFNGDPKLDPEFAQYYNWDMLNGKKASKLIHSFVSLLMYVKDELQAFGPAYTAPLLIPALGSKEFAPPITIAEYLLYLYEREGGKVSFLPDLYYKPANTYPLTPYEDFSRLEPKEGQMKDGVSKPRSALQKSLKNDLTSRQLSRTKPDKGTRKKGSPKRKPAEKPVERKKPRPISPPSPIATTLGTPKITPVVPEITPEPPIPAVIDKEKAEVIPEKEVIFSAFDDIDDLQILSPSISVEPKYQKIESRIASAMRTRRSTVEKKRREFFKKHLEKERKLFIPKPRNISLSFPPQISGNEVFGYFTLGFGDIKEVMYKFRNNPVIFSFKAKKGESVVQTSFQTLIDIGRLEKRGSVHIPCVVNLGDLMGDIDISVSAVTSTNESLLSKELRFKINRKDEIPVETKEFYLTGNYGTAECVYKAVNNSSRSEKGEFSIMLVSQTLSDPFPIYSSKFALEPNEELELATSVNLLVNFQHSTFFVVSRVKIGRFKKARAYKTIRVPILDEVIVDWDYVVDPSAKNGLNKGVVPKTSYEIDFVFHFLRSMPPATVTIYVDSFPTGQTKKLADFKLNRIDRGDEFRVPNIKFKTPRKCGYLYFFSEIRNQYGLIPFELISEPIGVHGMKSKRKRWI